MALSATDLRIGNLVIAHDNKPHKITASCIVAQSQFDIAKAVGYNPIPLTEEILLKCGFEKEVNYVKGITIQDGIAYFDDNEFGHSKEDEIECKYLHQLQNLYFSLTQKELTINF